MTKPSEMPSESDEVWGHAALYLGDRQITSQSLIEILEMQLILKVAEGRGADTSIQVPVWGAALIVDALKRSKQRRGRKDLSWMERQQYDNCIRTAKQHRRELIEKGIEPASADHLAAQLVHTSYPLRSMTTIQRDLQKAEAGSPYR